MKNEIILFENQKVKIKDKTVWLKQIAKIFNRNYKTKGNFDYE